MTTIINLNLARFLNILIVSFLANRGRSKSERINKKQQFVMWIAGLRGAMAYALAMKSLNDLPLGPLILITTLVYAFISILFVGSILNPIMRCCNVKRKEEELNES